MKSMMLRVTAVLVCAVLAAMAAPPGSQAESTMSGTLTSADGKFFLTDEATRTSVEVRGEGLEKYVGQRIRVSGQVAPGPAGAPQVLAASQVSRAAAVAGKAAKAAGVKAGLSKAAVVAVGAGATAATVGALYAADVIGEDKPVSRE
jgi:hypothetical protein